MKTIKTNRKLKYLFFIALIIMFYPMGVKGEELVKGENDFLFLGNENIAPLVYKENNKTKGLIVDIVEELGKRKNWNIEVQATNWEEAQSKVILGKADALLQINKSEERKELYDFSIDLLKSEFSIFKNCNDIHIKSIDDLKNKKVGVEELGYPRYFLKNHRDIEIVAIEDPISGFEMIDSGLIDAVVLDRWTGEYALAKSKLSGIRVIENPVETIYSNIAVGKGNEELLKEINKGLEEMKSDGTINKIKDHWRGEEVLCYTESEVNRNIRYVIFGIFILLILIALLTIRKLRKINKALELEVEKRTEKLYESNEKLKKLSNLDGLTNIFNRRYFDKAFKKVWKLSLREKLPLSLILLDIDYFKKCNDDYGHLAGDAYLKALAKILESAVRRPGDLVARFGGEEFIILLYNTPEEGGRILAEEIRRKVEKTSVDYRGIEIKNTISLGLASLVPSKDLNPNYLIELADEAMYEAKNMGRNKVCIKRLAKTQDIW